MIAPSTPVRITARCTHHGMTGTVTEVRADQDHPYRVDGLEAWALWFGEGEVVLVPATDVPSVPGEASGAQVAQVPTPAISAAQIDAYARDKEGRELVNRIIERKAGK